MTLPAITFGAANTGTHGWTCGQAFVKGEVSTPTSLRASSGVSEFQVDIRNLWGDGSLKFAVLSGVSVFSGSDVPVQLATSGTLTTGSDVAEPEIQASVQFSSPATTVELSTARTNGTMAWSKATAHKVREILGPVMSEFHYYSPVSGDNHLAVWWYVRAWSTGQVEVETIVENGWTEVASPGQKTYTATVNVNSTQRFSGAVTQYHHTRWSRVDFSGTDPEITPVHDGDYLQTTNLVPSYATSSLSATCLSTKPDTGTKFNAYTADLADRPTPFAVANFDPAMGSGGDTDGYGVLPIFGAAHVIAPTANTYQAVIANARAQGRYSLHYRDETDGRPMRGSSDTDLCISSSNSGLSEVSDALPTSTPSPSGGTTGPWYQSHSPSTGFLAYLLTGRWAFYEDGQFKSGTAERAVTSNWGGQRTIAYWAQLRHQAWQFRDYVQASHIAPQRLMNVAVTGAEQSQQLEAVQRVENTVAPWYNWYVSGGSTANPSCARGNVFGLPYENSDFQTTDASNNDGEHVYGGLQTGFWITALLYAFDTEPPIDATGMTEIQGLAEHAAKFPIGMIGAAPGQTTWDWRVCVFTAIGFGTPGATSPGEDAGGNTTFRTSWDAQWTAIQNNYTWEPDTFTDLAGESDSYLRKIQYNNVDALRLSTRTTVDANTDLFAFLWSLNYAAKISSKVTVSGADEAIAALQASPTWTSALTGFFLDRPETAVSNGLAPAAPSTRAQPDIAVILSGADLWAGRDAPAPPFVIPAWVPTTLNEGALVTMTNTLDNVDLAGVWAGDSAAQFASYSGGVYNPWYGDCGAHVIHGGGHAANNDNSVFLADYNDLTFKRVGGPTVLGTDAAYDAAITAGSGSVDNPCEYTAGVPGSAHTYDCLLVLPPSIGGDSLGSLIRPVSGAVGRVASRESGWSHVFHFTTNAWERWSTNNAWSWVAGGSCAHDTLRDKIWPINNQNMTFTPQLDLGTKSWSNNGAGFPGLGSNSYPDMVYTAYHAHRDIVVICTCGQSDTHQRFYWFDAASAGTARTSVTFTQGNLPRAQYGRGVLLDIPELNQMIYWTHDDSSGDSFYKITVPASPANEWSWEQVSITGDLPESLPLTPAGSTYKRMDYAPQLKSLIWVTARPLGAFQFGGQVLCIRIVP